MLENGQLVLSRKGRDTGRVYMVCGREDDRVLLANGGKWTRGAPKRKNVLHINPTGTVLPDEAKLTDHEIQKAVRAYEAQIAPPKGG